jgi:predicted restriction endonuclease
MLPKIKENQKIYFEITNLIHGGTGWELGDCLWSPKYNSLGGKSWKLMENVQINDIIIHLVKLRNNQYHFYGFSQVISTLEETTEEPPIPSTWKNKGIYQRISLINFSKIENPYPISKIFGQYEYRLKELINSDERFYSLSKDKLTVSQKYFTKCSLKLYEIFNEVSDLIKFSPEIIENFNNIIPTKHEPLQSDYNPPPRLQTTVSRIIRDTRLSRTTKSENNWKCQVCGKSISLPNGSNYSEGHHLQPLGGKYKGPDIKENILILCPNHHSEFDYGSIAINPETNIIEHIDPSNEYHLKELAYNRENLGTEFLQYHYNLIFNK